VWNAAQNGGIAAAEACEKSISYILRNKRYVLTTSRLRKPHGSRRPASGFHLRGAAVRPRAGVTQVQPWV